MGGLLGRAASRGTRIDTWIDVGASDGSWSLLARHHFPQARFLLFEPLTERQADLARLAKRQGFIPVPAAAGATAGIVEFAVDAALDGSGVARPGETQATRPVRVESVDAAVSAHQLTGPFGLKLDTHGYELPVLTGATHVLAHANLLIIESYNFQLGAGTLRFHELCAHLERLGFRCCDLADPMRRPGDGALWQMDLAFARTNDPIFDLNTYA
jgi:FkbM family methyltransferase